ncbi:MAG: dTDP-glucose 4,6-dehydratase [Pirellulaceae bacterium]|jgi:dTDP-glucose 4,6-dehydratase|nr:dTDP-glucose 4,6-dehydratase [Pirellulaceae bacterium]MDP7015846.1 dTDP-glucose 4,6-dehydratase [Pirellulaceae bacterium]
MQSLLVTGGAGFIGGCFVRQCLTSSTSVVNLDKLTYAANPDVAELRDANHTFVHGDIGDGDLVRRLFATHQPDAVFHFAAESHVDRSIDDPTPFVATNVTGWVVLLREALRHWKSLSGARREDFRIINVSTDEVYGTAAAAHDFTVADPFRPNSPYAASKAAAVHFGRAFFQTYGLPVVTTTSSNNYGPFQFPEKLTPLIALNAMQGRPLPVYGDGLQQRDWIHVEDHCLALHQLLAAGVPGGLYNVGSGRVVSNLDFVSMICQFVDELQPDAAPAASLIEHVTDRPGHDRRYALDTSELRGLGWRPQLSLEEGLRRTVRWYFEHREWVEKVESPGYGRQRLGLGEDSAADR